MGFNGFPRLFVVGSEIRNNRTSDNQPIQRKQPPLTPERQGNCKADNDGKEPETVEAEEDIED